MTELNRTEPEPRAWEVQLGVTSPPDVQPHTPPHTWPLRPGGAAPGTPGKGHRSLPGRGQQRSSTSVGSWPGSRRGAVSLHHGCARLAALDKPHCPPTPTPGELHTHPGPHPQSEAALQSGLHFVVACVSEPRFWAKVVQGLGSRGPGLCASCPLGPHTPGLFLAKIPKDLASFLLSPPPP